MSSDPNVRAALLWPNGAFRLGAHPADLGQSRSFPASDTLFGAIAWAMIARFGVERLERVLAQTLDGEPPFLVTSAMPLLRVDGRVEALVPYPVRRPSVTIEDPQDRKLFKRLAFVQKSLVPWLRQGAGDRPQRRGNTLLSAELAARLDSEAAGHSVLPSASTAAWDAAHLRPHVAVDRHTGASNLFSAGYTIYASTSSLRTGMLVGVIPRAPDAIELISGCLDVLSHTGLGGKRSTGAGGFTWEWSEAPVPVSLDPADGPSLSMIWPRPDECDLRPLKAPPDCGYRLVERMGWVSSPDWHGQLGRPVTMLGEGSFVNPDLRPVVGGLADVTPDPALVDRHPVYRWGLGTFLAEAEVSP